MKMYYDKDADLKVLKGKTVAIVGYGIQGRAHALCLKESGMKVIISDLKGSVNWKMAEEDGFKPMSASDAAKEADIVSLLTEDTVQPKVYKNELLSGLKKGSTLLFAHGFNILFNQIVPSKDIDIIMVAPKGPGSLVRRMYSEGKGVPCLIAVQQDASGKAKETALAYAKGIGGTKAGVIETTFKEETETDLFGEQAVLCGGASALIQTGFEVLVEAGYSPEMAYFECLHELKLITDMIQESGITGMRSRVSDTAEYGDLTRGPRLVTEETKKEMKKILKEIQDGEFAREWILENQANRPVFNALVNKGKEHLIEKTGKKLRSMMPWME